MTTTFLSLDGVMQAPGGPNEDRSGNFRQGGWIVPYFADDMGQMVVDNFAQADAFLLGQDLRHLRGALAPVSRSE